MQDVRLSVVTDAPYNAAMLVKDIGAFELIALLESRIRERNRVRAHDRLVHMRLDARLTSK